MKPSAGFTVEQLKKAAKSLRVIDKLFGEATVGNCLTFWSPF